MEQRGIRRSTQARGQHNVYDKNVVAQPVYLNDARSGEGGGLLLLSLFRQSSHIRRQGRISHIRFGKDLYNRRTQGTEIVPLFCHFTAIFSSSRRKRSSVFYKKNKNMMGECNVRFVTSFQLLLSSSPLPPKSTDSNVNVEGLVDRP